MPTGIVIMEWDDRIGANIITQYPRDTELSKRTLMQIYSTHEYSGEIGIVSLIIGNISICSYYSGSEFNLYIILIMLIDEEADMYEEGLIDISGIIIQNLKNETVHELIPKLFQRVCVFPTFEEYGRNLMLFTDLIKRVFLYRLREEGSILKSELEIWFKDEFGESFFIDIENIIQRFIKANVIKRTSIKDVTGDLLFLVNDVSLHRSPPSEIVLSPNARGLPRKLTKNYLNECRSFFNNYKISEEDNLLLLDLILDPQIYEVIKLLRLSIVTFDDFEKLKRKGVVDFDIILSKLKEANIITILKDENEIEYYCLISDVEIKKYFPKFLLNKIMNDYKYKTKNNNVLLEHLRILKEIYPKKGKNKNKIKN